MSSRDPRAASTSHAWHAIGLKELAAHFATDLQQGLTGSEAVSRLAADGPNELPSTPPVSAFRILLRQFTNLIVAVLLGAALLSGWLQDWMDAGAILVIVLLNGALGFVQEHKAERSLSALKRLSQTTAHVIRDGQSRTVAARELARGDVIEIDAGDRVPADVALVYAAALRTQEASLTGESVPVTKRVETLPAQTALADRTNMLFVGTTVSAGKGRGVVVATGLDTELGRMSTLVETAERESTPFQRRWED